jgi:hypothetical protein
MMRKRTPKYGKAKVVKVPVADIKQEGIDVSFPHPLKSSL